MRQTFYAFLLAFAVFNAPALAVQPDEILQDKQLETRARALSAQLRCMVCQNESIDESEATLARDLRQLLRERLVAGDSDEAIEKFLVSRYGDFILLKPPLKPETVLLWAAPFALLVAGAVILVLRRRREPDRAGEILTTAEHARLRAILIGSESEKAENTQT